MKHLKKLSVAIMMVTLFSVSFTSCIDNEVSPLVEAIYEAQADLIAAQAGVQNAEAALLLAQAANQQANSALLAAQAAAATSIAQGQLAVLLANAGLTDAQAQAVLAAAEGNLAQALADAGLTDAIAAQILADIAIQEANAEYTAAVREQQLLVLAAQTSLDVATLQNELELAQVTFQTQLAAAVAAMEAAGAQLAVGYAWDYALAMQHANNLMSQLLGAQANLASAQLMQNGNVSWAYSLAQLQGAVATNMAAKADLETAITDLEAYIANPSTPEAIISGLKAQNVAYHEAMDAKEIEMQVQYNKIMALYQQDGVRDDLVSRVIDGLNEHNYAVDEKNARLEDIAAAQIDVNILIAKKATYAADLQAATDAVTNTTQAYNDAWTALGMTNGAGVSYKTAANTYFGLYFEVDADGDPIAVGATKYATPANLQQAYVNARIAKLDAVADLADYQADFDALVLTYNQAAVTLAAAQAAFDANTYAADLTAANLAYTAALGVRNTAQTTYNDAKTAFEIDPAGSVVTDGVGIHSTPYAWFNTIQFDLGNKGIEDLIPTTYMRVTSWRETVVGSGLYIPATFAATKYTPTTLAAAITAIKADVVTNNITANSQIYIWQDLISGMPVDDYDGLSYSVDAHYLNSTIPAATALALPTAAVFVEVESDDTAVPTLYTFNVATNMLGTNNFSARPFFTSGAGTLASPYVFNTVLTPASTDAGYDSTPNPVTGEPNSAADMLTAQAALWNAGLEVFKKQNAFDLGDDALIIAEDAFAYQKELFDFGVANLAILTQEKDDAILDETAAKTAVDHAWLALGVEYAAGIATDTKKTTSTAGAWYYVNFVSGTKALTKNAIVFNAEVDKAKLAACDAACIQGQIDALNASIAQWTIEIAAIEPIIVAKYNVVAGLLNELTAAGVQYTFTIETDVTTGNLGIGTLVITNYGVLSSLYPDIHAQIIAEWQVYWAMQQELDALQNAHDLNINLISAYGWWADDLNDLADYLANLKADLVNANYDIEVAQQALASAQVNANAATASIAYYQALIVTLQQRHANTLAIAAKYKALMDAALAS